VIPVTELAQGESVAELVNVTDGGPVWHSRVLRRSLEDAARRSLERGRVYVQAAQKLMEESGSAGFTVQQVADLAGQSLRSLYQFFGSKDDLILAVLEELLRRQVETARRAVNAYTDPVDRLAAFVLTTASLSERERPWPLEAALAHFSTQLLSTRPQEIATAQAPYTALTQELISDALAAGRIPPCDPERAAFFVTSLKSAYLRAFVLGNDVGTSMPRPVEVARFCLRGLGTDLPKEFERD
jgi:AcrR family transcriptional regulator